MSQVQQCQKQKTETQLIYSQFSEAPQPSCIAGRAAAQVADLLTDADEQKPQHYLTYFCCYYRLRERAPR